MLARDEHDSFFERLKILSVKAALSRLRLALRLPSDAPRAPRRRVGTGHPLDAAVRVTSGAPPPCSGTAFVSWDSFGSGTPAAPGTRGVRGRSGCPGTRSCPGRGGVRGHGVSWDSPACPGTRTCSGSGGVLGRDVSWNTAPCSRTRTCPGTSSVPEQNVCWDGPVCPCTPACSRLVAKSLILKPSRLFSWICHVFAYWTLTTTPRRYSS